MKRILSFTLFIGVLLLVFQFLVTYFNPGHEIEYQFRSNDKDYQIDERLFLREGKPVYRFQITYDGKTFLFENDKDYNKKKKLITSIRTFEKEGITCLAPVYQEVLEDVHDIQCVFNHQQFTYTALKNQYSFLNEFETQLMSEGSILPSWLPQENGVALNGMTVYQKDILDDIYLGIWQYQGLQVVSKESQSYTVMLYEDSYQEKGVLVGQYYVIPNYDSRSEFGSVLLADVVNFGYRELFLDSMVSKDCYFQGVVDDKAYLFDRTNIKQYEINPATKNIREVGNVELNAQYYDGEKWSDRNIYDFVNQKVLFGKDYSKVEALSKYQTTSIVETEDSYYFSTQNSVYQLWKEDLDHPILLFSLPNIRELQVVDGTIFAISGTTLYSYHDAIGLKQLVINNEFQYNNQMYVVYKK